MLSLFDSVSRAKFFNLIIDFSIWSTKKESLELLLLYRPMLLSICVAEVKALSCFSYRYTAPILWLSELWSTEGWSQVLDSLLNQDCTCALGNSPSQGREPWVAIRVLSNNRFPDFIAQRLIHMLYAYASIRGAVATKIWSKLRLSWNISRCSCDLKLDLPNTSKHTLISRFNFRCYHWQSLTLYRYNTV